MSLSNEKIMPYMYNLSYFLYSHELFKLTGQFDVSSLNYFNCLFSKYLLVFTSFHPEIVRYEIFRYFVSFSLKKKHLMILTLIQQVAHKTLSKRAFFYAFSAFSVVPILFTPETFGNE